MSFIFGSLLILVLLGLAPFLFIWFCIWLASTGGMVTWFIAFVLGKSAIKIFDIAN
ncbi:hypothetical protein H8K32_13860 [Undibacterium jejuense]|uniref:Uncharacterized protein n=1 Tax=Undibacterium jejuense TaxID=1344949 RepID=A0A923HFQ2_9BURK|nr:hypothetical protein [Undibacterium jejuense]MBC3863191.1 hypothetical protein [Undibacterium jejuense]